MSDCLSSGQQLRLLHGQVGNQVLAGALKDVRGHMNHSNELRADLALMRSAAAELVRVAELEDGDIPRTIEARAEFRRALEELRTALRLTGG